MDDLEPPDWMDDGPPIGDEDATPARSGLIAQHLSDMGNAARLIAMHGEDLRYVSGIGWYYWTGTHWEVDRKGRVQEAAKQTIAEFRKQAERAHKAAVDDGETEQAIALKAVLSYSKASESAARISAMVSLACSDPAVAWTTDDLDAHPYLLNAANGTIDLRSGALGPHDRKHLITTCAPASLRQWTELPTVSVLNAFMESIQPDAETQAFIWRCIGMSLIGEQRDHVVLFAYGEGGNGKGTLFRAVKSAIGRYYCPIPSDMLIDKQSRPHAAQTAQLMGKRFVVADELPTNKSFDAAEVKRLSGGDDIAAQFMRQNWFSFKPSHTLWLQGNDKPHANAGDYGMWRRMKLIPFMTKVVAMDNDLDRKLDAERDIVLRMAVDGAVAYLRDGLGSCPEVDAATTQYREDEDAFGQFLSECCEIGLGLNCSKESLRAAIERWWKAEGKLRAPTNQTIKQELIKRGISQSRPSGSKGMHWSGLQLNQETSGAIARMDERWP